MTKTLPPERNNILHEDNQTEIEKTNISQKKWRQRDSWWSWIICVFGIICMIIVLGCGYCFGIVFSDLLDVFREGKSSTGEYYYRLVTESQVVVRHSLYLFNSSAYT